MTNRDRPRTEARRTATDLELPLDTFERPALRPGRSTTVRDRERPPRSPRREPERPPIQFKNDRSARGGMPRRQQILLPFIALIAMGAGGVAAVAITNQPQTRTLQHEVFALQSQLASARQELGTLQHTVAANSEVHRLSNTVAGLRRTVGGLQAAALPLKVTVDALSVCVPQLQSELAGATVGGRGKQTSLVGLATISPGCAAVLGGG